MSLSAEAEAAAPEKAPVRGRLAGAAPAVVLYTVTSLVASGLLFSVEPMVAKLLLPAYGGSPMVWNTAVLFFQGALLAGYAYAHWSQRRLGRRWQPLVHVVLVAAPLAALPIALPGWTVAPESAPTALWLLLVLAALVGAPFAVLATTGPLVQRWYSWSGLPRSDDPYFLYAAGNAGSLVALLAYPFVIEPAAGLVTQTRWWSAGYVGFVVLMVLCAIVVRTRRPAETAAADTGPDEPITWRRRAGWLALAFLPSSLMLGVTTHISTDIAPVPLMWVVPLALYLLTFIVAFGVRSGRWLPATVTVAAACAAILPVVFALLSDALPAYVLALDLVVLAVGGLACHGLLARDRPGPARLTEFFLLVSLGGTLGGLFNGLLAPLVFDWVAELPLAVAALALLLWAGPRPSTALGWTAKAALLAGPTLMLLLFVLVGGTWGFLLGTVLAVASCVLLTRTRGAFALLVAVALVLLIGAQYRDSPHRERTFFGAYQVKDEGELREFSHGTTVHGTQFRDPARRRVPTSYYARGGPLGDVSTAYGTADRVAVVGLGAGTVAAYGRPGQRFDFYEIDPAVVRIARDRFTYLRDCPCDARTVVGDGRLRLAEAPDGAYGLIVLDAFSSDAVPAHLLTREALRVYMRKLRPGGVLAFHVSNRHLDLAPMLGATARAEGLAAVSRTGGREDEEAAHRSQWVALARDTTTLRPLTDLAAPWRAVAPTGPVWTDAYSSLWGVLRITDH
ncbi:fused MFS/spermidine synthase [Spirillospora albida]|uniref:fused MFS/spermidine synthase n=1 Tax=Spirillospora albida TaxID=58123 RepID=UPI0004BFA49F|nr:fused MFS/spermidine synthase [Spirillospora albida]